MAVKFTNRRKDLYYLHVGQTKTGKRRYYLSKNSSGTLAKKLPAGFEVYENPEKGRLYLRKKRPSRILPLEHQMLADGIRKYAQIDYFVLDVAEDTLTVYLPNVDVEAAAETLTYLTPEAKLKYPSLKDWLLNYSDYFPEIRFVLTEENRRLFMLERMCYRTAATDWLPIAGPAPLNQLITKFLKHLGKESLFDLP
jgi:hypothetical protein